MLKNILAVVGALCLAGTTLLLAWCALMFRGKESGGHEAPAAPVSITITPDATAAGEPTLLGARYVGSCLSGDACEMATIRRVTTRDELFVGVLANTMALADCVARSRGTDAANLMSQIEREFRESLLGKDR